MLQGNVFKTLINQWSTGLLRRRAVNLMLLLVCLAINISRYYMCLDDSDTWLSFVQRLMMVTICTPSSIVLEWVCLRLYSSYIAKIQCLVLDLLSGGGGNSKPSVLSSYLARGYLSEEELCQWKITVRRSSVSGR